MTGGDSSAEPRNAVRRRNTEPGRIADSVLLRQNDVVETMKGLR